METRKEYVSLSGAERVSLLLLALGEEQVQKLFALLDESEIKQVATTMANLGKISSTVVEVMFSDFVDQLSSTGALVGSLESTRRLLIKAMPKEKVDSLMEELSGPAGRTMWDKLSNVNEALLANYLRNEYPQTIAVVLARIRPEVSSKVMSLLPEGIVMEVVMRMLKMESVRREILDDIERTLKAEFTVNIAKTPQRDSYELMAEIFNLMDRPTETKFISALEERNLETAERIKSLMFTFEDILKLNSTAIQSIIRVADKTKLSLALKGANENIQSSFFKSMSERAAKLMKEDMEAMGMVRVRDVDDAQTYIIATAKALSAKGEIVLRNGSEKEDELIG